MIVNEPNHASLNAAALRFHFSAWEIVIDVIRDFDEHYEVISYDNEIARDVEWQQYRKSAQFDLETLFTYVAQASELALRGRICSISPFLLLMNTDNKFRRTASDIDFSELRTIDAVDVPSVANGVCDAKLSEKFTQQYQMVRSLRNKIVHMGEAGLPFKDEGLITLLCDQYNELWSNKHFFRSWIGFSSKKRTSYFNDDKNYSDSTDAMLSIPFFSKYLNKGQFNNLFGFSKYRRRYVCHYCCYAACLEQHGLELMYYKSAYLKENNLLYCGVCENEFGIERKRCVDPHCKGNVIFSDEGFAPSCCACGYEQELLREQI